jgi:hypothetical protein
MHESQTFTASPGSCACVTCVWGATSILADASWLGIVDFDEVGHVDTMLSTEIVASTGDFEPRHAAGLLAEASWLGEEDFGAVGHVDTMLSGGVVAPLGDFTPGAAAGFLAEASWHGVLAFRAAGHVDTIFIDRLLMFIGVAAPRGCVWGKRSALPWLPIWCAGAAR